MPAGEFGTTTARLGEPGVGERGGVRGGDITPFRSGLPTRIMPPPLTGVLQAKPRGLLCMGLMLRAASIGGAKAAFTGIAGRLRGAGGAGMVIWPGFTQWKGFRFADNMAGGRTP